MICSGVGMAERRILIAAGLSPFAPQRAAERARALAMQTGTALVVRENGRLCRITFVDGREVIEPLDSQ